MLSQLEKIHTIEPNGPGVGLNETQNCASGSGLAAARFTDQAERFSLIDVETDVVNRLYVSSNS